MPAPMCVPGDTGVVKLERFLKEQGAAAILGKCPEAGIQTLEALAALAIQEQSWNDFTDEAGISAKVAKRLAAALAELPSPESAQLEQFLHEHNVASILDAPMGVPGDTGFLQEQDAAAILGKCPEAGIQTLEEAFLAIQERSWNDFTDEAGISAKVAKQHAAALAELPSPESAQLEQFLHEHKVASILDACVAAGVTTIQALAALAIQEEEWDDFSEQAGMSAKAAKRLHAALADSHSESSQSQTAQLERFLEEQNAASIFKACMAADVKTVEALAALASQGEKWDDFTDEASISNKVARRLLAALGSTGHAQIISGPSQNIPAPQQAQKAASKPAIREAQSTILGTAQNNIPPPPRQHNTAFQPAIRQARSKIPGTAQNNIPPPPQPQNTAFLDDDERQEILDYWGEGKDLLWVLKRMRAEKGSTRAETIAELFNRCSMLKDEPTNLLELFVKGQKNPLPLRWYPGLPEQNYNPALRYHTLLVLGETGVGKTTLLDAFVNHLAGMNYQDLWRYKLVNENSIVDKAGSQSQTTEITDYYITDQRMNLREEEKCHVKIIDSPGFGDTGGIETDKAIAEKFGRLFTTDLEEIDYVLVVVKATESRWTQRAKYVYDNVQQLFGEDADKRFVLMCTFADGGECLAASTIMPQMPCLCDQYFTFNNSALYTPKKLGNPSTRMFWDMCMSSVKNFLKFIKSEGKPPLSLVQSKDVILTRDYLKASITSTRGYIKSCMDGLEYLHKVLQDIAENEEKINANGSYTLPPQKVTKYRWVKRTDAKPTQFCRNCQVPCCQICSWPMGEDESQCTYFNGGRDCPVCPGHCARKAHRRWVEVDYQEKYEVEEQGIDVFKKNMLEEGQQGKSFAENLLAEKQAETEDLAKKLLQAMQSVKESQKKLEEIALKPRVFTDLEYFEQMIKTETDEKKPGWDLRVKNLEAMRDEVKAAKQYETVNNLEDLFPEYQKVISATIRKRKSKRAVPGTSQANSCVIS